MGLSFYQLLGSQKQKAQLYVCPYAPARAAASLYAHPTPCQAGKLPPEAPYPGHEGVFGNSFINYVNGFGEEVRCLAEGFSELTHSLLISSILWDYFTLLLPVSFGENWYSKVYAGHSLNEFPLLRRQYWGRHMWARGYFCCSSGNVTDEVIKQYIAQQEDADETFRIEGE